MVKMLKDLPLAANGRVDVARWSEQLCDKHETLDGALIESASQHLAGANDERFLLSGIELAELVAGLNLDTESVLAALCYRPVRLGQMALDDVARQWGAETAELLDAVLHLADVRVLELSNSRLQTSEAKDQLDNVRSMLAALMDDGRVAVLKLAERVVALRLAKSSSEERRERIGREAAEIFAPLAGRLGIWRLKWELEDLSLRYLDPGVYSGIARQLDGRRAERESQVATIVELLERTFSEQGIDATVFGRAKHIYSIWRKMRTKNIPFDQVYDVLAVRVIVASVAQCYSALGVIHTRWQHIPSEFDDYVASPKDNGYRSIHTAVVGPDNRTFEVQIRTAEMHSESELGVCAHWSYKGTPGHGDPGIDAAYAQKMDWLRQLLELDDPADEQNLPGVLARTERVFVYTPGGHVIDMTDGATVLDFAYRVHTEIGHTCVGGKVDGEWVPLRTRLTTGQRVEIETDERQTPKMIWLNPALGFVHTARARDKIQGWFRAQSSDERRRRGQRLLDNMTTALDTSPLSAAQLARLAPALGETSSDEVLESLGVGDLLLREVATELFGVAAPPEQLSLLPGTGAEAILENFRLRVEGDNREGLLHDLTALLGERHLSLISAAGRVDQATGAAVLELEIRLEGLAKVWHLIEEMNCVEGVHRVLLDRNDTRG